MRKNPQNFEKKLENNLKKLLIICRFPILRIPTKFHLNWDNNNSSKNKLFIYSILLLQKFFVKFLDPKLNVLSFKA